MRKYLLYIAGVLSFSACNQELEIGEQKCELTSLTVSVSPYDGETDTRANVEGTGFEVGDWIRLKMICPFADETQTGETIDNGYYDGFWVLKYAGGTSLTPLTESDGCDLNGDFVTQDAPNVLNQYLSQQTPYVFVAQTWNEEKVFHDGLSRYLQYSYSFQADQSKADGSAYKKSDLLWAQQFMQTATPNVHLAFTHKMAALKISIDDSDVKAQKVDAEGNLLYNQDDNSEGTTVTDNPVMVPAPISANAVLTLEGMPDIDQMEVVVGDYYAAKDCYTTTYGYKDQASCTKENNGKVMGVVVLNHSTKKAVTTSIASMSQMGTYKAYHDVENSVYRLIVPPCTVTAPVLYLRDGNRRFKVELSQKVFVQGTMYNLTMKLSNPVTQ